MINHNVINVDYKPQFTLNYFNAVEYDILLVSAQNFRKRFEHFFFDKCKQFNVILFRLKYFIDGIRNRFLW